MKLIFYLIDTTTYICDFHREQSWERWLRKTENGLSESREEVLSLSKKICKSQTSDILSLSLETIPLICNFITELFCEGHCHNCVTENFHISLTPNRRGFFRLKSLLRNLSLVPQFPKKILVKQSVAATYSDLLEMGIYFWNHTILK